MVVRLFLDCQICSTLSGQALGVLSGQSSLHQREGQKSFWTPGKIQKVDSRSIKDVVTCFDSPALLRYVGYLWIFYVLVYMLYIIIHICRILLCEFLTCFTPCFPKAVRGLAGLMPSQLAEMALLVLASFHCSCGLKRSKRSAKSYRNRWWTM